MTAVTASQRTASHAPRRVYPAVTRRRTGDVRAIHRARVASRRLRELLAAAAARPRDVAQSSAAPAPCDAAAGAVRELDVTVQLVEDLRKDVATAVSGCRGLRPAAPGTEARARQGRPQGRFSVDLKRIAKRLGPSGRPTSRSARARGASLALGGRGAGRPSGPEAEDGDRQGRPVVSARTGARRAGRVQEAALRARTGHEAGGVTTAAVVGRFERRRSCSARCTICRCSSNTCAQAQAALATPQRRASRELDGLSLRGSKTSAARLHARYVPARTARPRVGGERPLPTVTEAVGAASPCGVQA